MKDSYDFDGEMDIQPWKVHDGRHRWNYHDKYATCAKCGIVVKAWRAKTSRGLPECLGNLTNNSFSPDTILYDKKIIYYHNILSRKHETLNHDWETELFLLKALEVLK